MSITVSTDFQLDDAAVEEIGRSDDVMGVVRNCAETIGAVARGYCVRHIADTIEILEEDSALGAVYVGSRSSFAHLWEFGSIKTPTLAFMRSAAIDVADRFE